MAERLKPERRHGPGVSRTYRSEAIEVTWEPAFCIHVARCWRGLPEVFHPQQTPWITPEAAEPDAIAKTILRCPTGALHFRRLDGGQQEQDPVTVEVRPIPHGPLYVRGRIRILGRDGSVIREDTRLALCRCGHSRNKPFCDGSHLAVEFRSEE
jgi:uncharacterized Fe-S cluster protein YjdI